MVLNFKKIAEGIKEGKVAVCPTDTIYGLIADATNEKAVKKIFRIKKREKSKAIPIFVKDIKMAKKLAFVDKEQEEFLRENWPGKVTVILKRKLNCGLPEILFGGKPRTRASSVQGKKTIGLRIPKYKLINKILKKINKPLTGTSANISGKPASTKIKDILKQFRNRKRQPDLIINMGNLKKSKPSKIVDLTGKRIKVLRH